MRLAMLLTYALLAQGALRPFDAPAPTSHLRYERTLSLPHLPAQGTYPVCAVLDAAAFAHTASRSEDDLRLYREPASGSSASPVETPFSLLESEAAPDEAASAAVQNLAVKDGAITFDLAMPHQDYTAVELHLNAADFIAEASVSSGSKALGTFTLFDLTQLHLARSTELALQETHLPRLQVVLRLWHLDGSPVQHPAARIVQGAEVPPSRQAQTLYTTVAATTQLHDDHGASVATLTLPAHVPVERLRVLLPAGDHQNLFRRVSIYAMPQVSDAGTVEAVQGTIARIDWKAPSGSAPPVHYESLAVDATLGANLRQPALVRVTIPQPLPIGAVELQMRQRSLCFQAVAGAAYTLRYGDAGLSAPVYDDRSSGAIQRAASLQTSWVALLGPEQQNTGFTERRKQADFGQARPGIFWIGLLSLVTLCGALAAHRTRHDRRRR